MSELPVVESSSIEVSNNTFSTDTDASSNLPSYDYHIVPSQISKNPSMKLPKGYQPSNFDVICGRGRGHYNQPGNIRFRSIINSKLNEYQLLKTKLDKSIFFNKILDEVRSQADGNAYFLRHVSYDSWEILSDDQAREKIGHAIRESLLPRNKPSLKSQAVVHEPVSKLTSDPFASTDLPSTDLSDSHNGLEDTFTIRNLLRQRTDSFLDTIKISMPTQTTKRAATFCCQSSSWINEKLPCMINTSENKINSKIIKSTSSTEQTNIGSGLLLEQQATEKLVPSIVSTNNDAWSEYQVSKKEAKQLDLLLDDFGDDEMYVKVNNYYDSPEAANDGLEDKDDDDDSVCKRISNISITGCFKFYSVDIRLAEEFCKINCPSRNDIICSKTKDDDDDFCRRISSLSVLDGLNVSINTLSA